MNFNTAGYYNGYSNLDYSDNFHHWYDRHENFEVRTSEIHFSVGVVVLLCCGPPIYTGIFFWTFLIFSHLKVSYGPGEPELVYVWT